jgi:hypothetical protein
VPLSVAGVDDPFVVFCSEGRNLYVSFVVDGYTFSGNPNQLNR